MTEKLVIEIEAANTLSINDILFHIVGEVTENKNFIKPALGESGTFNEGWLEVSNKNTRGRYKWERG